MAMVSWVVRSGRLARLGWPVGAASGLLALLWLLLGGFGPLPMAWAAPTATITVNSTADNLTGNNGLCTLREAVRNANANNNTGFPECVAGSGADTISLPAGVYTLTLPTLNENANAGGDLDATDAAGLTLIGAGAESTILHIVVADRVLHAVAGPLTVRNLTVQNGNVAGDGGGIFTEGELVLRNSVVQSNTAAGQGGGVYVDNRATFTNATFISNTALGGLGGGALLNGQAQFSGGVFQLNTASHATLGNGGGAYATRTLTLADTVFQTNTAAQAGGGVYANNTVAFTGVTFISNTAGAAGGGLYADGTYTMTGWLTNTQFTRNVAHTQHGGGAYFASAAHITDGQFVENQARATNSYGGGLFLQQALWLTRTAFLSNTAATGGGFSQLAVGGGTLFATTFISNVAWGASGSGGGGYASGVLTVTNAWFERNQATVSGGGLGVNPLTPALITGSTFIANQAQQSGGGLNGSGYLTHTVFQSNTATHGGGAALTVGALHNVTVTQNQATQTGGGALLSRAISIRQSIFQHNQASYGGGVYANEAVTVTNSQFNSNSAANGGGLYIRAGHSHFTNVLFAGNHGNLWGLALYAAQTSTVTLQHVTIVSPTLGLGAALYVPAGRLVLSNTIVASYTIGVNNYFSGVVEAAHTLFSQVPTPFYGLTVTASQIYSGAAGFADHAAYTLTTASQAIDAGANAGVSTDYFGNPRPQGNAPDLGYAESAYTAFPLNLYRAGAGSGLITPTVGTHYYVSGTVVPLTVTANFSAFFAGWSGACSGTGPCTVPMTANRSVTATFATHPLRLPFIWR